MSEQNMNGQRLGRERRRFVRVRASPIVSLKGTLAGDDNTMILGRYSDAIMLDISEGGVAILANFDIPASSLLNLRFILCNDGEFGYDNRIKSIEAVGQVRYNIGANAIEHRLGISFVHLGSEERLFISRFVKNECKVKQEEV